jgi:hypothetical protein
MKQLVSLLNVELNLLSQSRAIDRNLFRECLAFGNEIIRTLFFNLNYTIFSMHWCRREEGCLFFRFVYD